MLVFRPETSDDACRQGVAGAGAVGTGAGASPTGAAGGSAGTGAVGALSCVVVCGVATGFVEVTGIKKYANAATIATATAIMMAVEDPVFVTGATGLAVSVR